MIAVDTSVLVYAHRADAPLHRSSVGVLRELIEGSAPWMIPWPCIHEFLEVVTRADLFPVASTTAQALRDQPFAFTR